MSKHILSGQSTNISALKDMGTVPILRLHSIMAEYAYPFDDIPKIVHPPIKGKAPVPKKRRI